jgi:hypothetical protein
MLRSVGSKVTWVGRTASTVFGLVQPLNLRAPLLMLATVTLPYATALLAVVYAYRKGYGIVGKPELAAQSLAKSFARVCS